MIKSAIVKKRNGKWVLLTRDGERVLGTHSKPQDAYKQEYAIEKSKERQKSAAPEVNPSPAQILAGNYRKDHMSFQGLNVTIENRKGSVRRGVDPSGARWKVTMPADYGYVKGTVGNDGDHVDVYVGPNKDSFMVYVINQKDLMSGRFDEHKCMLGFKKKKDAVKTYVSGFSDNAGQERIMGVKSMTIRTFKKWLNTGKLTKEAQSALALPGRPAAQTANAGSVIGGNTNRNKFNLAYGSVKPKQPAPTLPPKQPAVGAPASLSPWMRDQVNARSRLGVTPLPSAASLAQNMNPSGAPTIGPANYSVSSVVQPGVNIPKPQYAPPAAQLANQLQPPVQAPQPATNVASGPTPGMEYIDETLDILQPKPVMNNAAIDRSFNLYNDALKGMTVVPSNRQANPPPASQLAQQVAPPQPKYVQQNPALVQQAADDMGRAFDRAHPPASQLAQQIKPVSTPVAPPAAQLANKLQSAPARRYPPSAYMMGGSQFGKTPPPEVADGADPEHGAIVADQQARADAYRYNNAMRARNTRGLPASTSQGPVA